MKSVMSFALDPAVVLLTQGSLSLLFAVGAIHKLTHRRQFLEALTSYQLTTPRFSVAMARMLPFLELLVATGIWLAVTRVIASQAAIALFAIYAAAIGINLARGRRHLDCGCTASGRRSPIAGWMLARHAILAAVAVLASAPITSRTLTLIDALTVAGGLCVLTLIYLAADGLLANAASARRVGFQP
jgi:hypothetical protein